MKQIQMNFKPPRPSQVSGCENCGNPRKLVWCGLCIRCMREGIEFIRKCDAAIQEYPRPLACRYATCNHKRCMVRRIKALRNRLKGIADAEMFERDIKRICERSGEL